MRWWADFSVLVLKYRQRWDDPFWKELLRKQTLFAWSNAALFFEEMYEEVFYHVRLVSKA